MEHFFQSLHWILIVVSISHIHSFIQLDCLFSKKLGDRWKWNTDTEGIVGLRLVYFRDRRGPTFLSFFFWKYFSFIIFWVEIFVSPSHCEFGVSVNVGSWEFFFFFFLVVKVQCACVNCWIATCLSLLCWVIPFYPFRRWIWVVFLVMPRPPYFWGSLLNLDIHFVILV